MYDLTNDELFDLLSFIVHQQDRSFELGRFMSRFHIVYPTSRVFAEGYVAVGDPTRSPCLVTLTEKGYNFYSAEKQRREARADQHAQQETAQRLQQELTHRQTSASWWQSLVQVVLRFLGFGTGLFLILRR